jgi:serine/threonine protein kinase
MSNPRADQAKEKQPPSSAVGEPAKPSSPPSDSSGWIKIQPVKLSIQPGQTPSVPPPPANAGKESTQCIVVPPSIVEKNGESQDHYADLSFKPRNYAIESMVAEGGMGAIHRATDRNTQRTVAMKVLRDDKPLSRQDVLRFVQEAQINAQLEHPNIVPVYELGQDAGNKPYYTMKLVRGVTLEDVLEGIRKGDASTGVRFPLAALLTIFEKVCDAVGFAHSKGIVHRDLKPGNVMVGEYGEVLVLDWGMAKVLAGDPLDAPETESLVIPPNAKVNVKNSNLTFGCLLGTPSFMAPEQAENRPIDARADIYTLGGILYNILTLHSPHGDAEVFDMLERIKEGRIPSPSTYNPPSRARRFGLMRRKEAPAPLPERLIHCPEERVPEALASIAMKALALRAEDRYQDVRSLQKDIQAYQGGFITSAETKGLWKSLKLLIKRHRTESMLLAAALGIILALTAAYVVGLVSSERAKRAALQAQLKAEEDRRALEEKTAAERRRNWRLVFKDDFSDPNVLSRWEIKGPWTVKNGELQLGEAEQFVRLKPAFPGDVRLVFDCHKESDNPSDLSCFVNGLKSQLLESAHDGGYFFQYGGWGNQRNLLRGPSGYLRNDCASPLIRGRRYHVDVQKMGNRLIMVVDGNTVFDVRDERPAYGMDRATVGFYNYRSLTCISNVQVYTRDAAISADLLEVAEDYFLREKYISAQDLFQEVLNSGGDPERVARAEAGLKKTARHIRLAADFPSIRARLLKVWPRATVTLDNNGIVVDITALNVKDLSPLRGLMVSELTCDSNRISSLEPLRGMELRFLSCGENRIASLDPLRGMPLVKLLCSGNQIKDLEPLRGMGLKRLICNGNRISSLEPLQGMKLSELRFSDNQIASLEPLRNMDLIVLGFWNNQISSLEPLRGMRLVDLSVGQNQVRDLDPLRGMKLVSFECGGNRIASLEPLRGMNLETMDISDNRVASLEPLRGMPLSMLSCRDNPLKSLRPVLENPPQKLMFDQENLSTEDWALLKQRSGQLPYGRILRNAQIQLHFKNKDWASVKSMAREFGGRRYLVVPLSRTWPEARKDCEMLGGHLAVITSQQLNDFLCPHTTRAWIGLKLEGNQRQWITGEPFAYNNLSPYSEPINGCGSIDELGKWWAVDPTNKVMEFCVEWDP